MDLKAQLLNFLANLPEVDGPDKRKAVIALSGFPHLGIYLDWQGSNMVFFTRLLEELGRRGKASLVQFLKGLSTLPHLGKERQEQTGQLHQAVEALSEDEWKRQFAVAEPLQAKDQAPDADMLATSVVSTVLTPYFKLGKDGLQQEAGAGAVRLAEKVWKKVQAAVEDVPSGSVILRFYPKDPEDAQADLVSLLRDQLKVDRALARDLADQLASAEQEDEAALRTIINVAQRVGTIKGSASVVGAVLGTDALSWVGPVNIEQTADSLADNAVMTGAVIGNTGSIGGQHHHDNSRTTNTTFNQEGQTVQGGQNNVAGDVEQIGNRHEQNIKTGGGAFVGGSVSAGDDFVGRDKHVGGDEVRGDKIGGDRIDVGDISGSSGVAIGRGASASVSHGMSAQDLATVAQIFQPVYARIEQSPQPPAMQNLVRQQVQTIEEEAKKGSEADEQQVEDAFTVIKNIASDILEVVATALVNPVQGVSMVVQKVALRMRARGGTD